MKEFFIVIFLFLFFSSHAQDIIVFKKGEELKTKVLEVGTKEIKYKKFDNLDGPIFIVKRSEVIMIKYANGTKDSLTFVRHVNSHGWW